MLLRIPTITNITGIGPLFESQAVAYLIARNLYKVAMRHPSRVFFQNSDDRELFLAKGLARKEKTQVIPGSGIDHVWYAPRPRRENQLRTFLLTSRLVRDKGLGEYVNAARLLKDSHPQIRCQLLGPLWTQNLKVNSVTREDLDSWQGEGLIEYLGSTDDTRDFYAAADCVVLPSYREGTSNVLLEASSMARPVIATNVTGYKEIVQDGVTGLLCEPRDSRSLYQAMVEMAECSPEERAAMGQSGRERVIRKYDKKLVVEAYRRAVQEVLG